MSNHTIPIVREQDFILIRSHIQELCAETGMNLINQTKLITAASELVRNILNYAKSGKVMMEIVSINARQGIKLTFTDEGPGIENLQAAMQDGYSTSSGMGLGLPGAKRLVSEFAIQSAPGKGTIVTLIHWKDGH
ncbi:anti-sigma regulatory factor [Pontibacter sp. 172403-2]|uniref:anti-sigma regulatory factor n=1 Tax=Pontibacter rufus TaxID=2791028 RepID=UPI0018AF7B95|nr:anti-sigma regulatory factor [Pontibacter sp. 172403-2]MBF9255438.1 anti-sigma regulatory factor [Pontibacter sp. 172403-2]